MTRARRVLNDRARKPWGTMGKVKFNNATETAIVELYTGNRGGVRVKLFTLWGALLRLFTVKHNIGCSRNFNGILVVKFGTMECL